MSNVAVIDGVTGPGRRTLLVSEVQEIAFNFKKKVISVTNFDGSLGQYDLVEVNSVVITSEEKEYTVSVTSQEDTSDRTRETDPIGTAKADGTTGSGREQDNDRASKESGGTSKDSSGAGKAGQLSKAGSKESTGKANERKILKPKNVMNY